MDNQYFSIKTVEKYKYTYKQLHIHPYLYTNHNLDEKQNKVCMHIVVISDRNLTKEVTLRLRNGLQNKVYIQHTFNTT